MNNRVSIFILYFPNYMRTHTHDVSLCFCASVSYEFLGRESHVSVRASGEQDSRRPRRGKLFLMSEFVLSRRNLDFIAKR